MSREGDFRPGRRFSFLTAIQTAQGVAPSDFITLDLQTSLPEIVVEMERNGGRMRIHVK